MIYEQMKTYSIILPVRNGGEYVKQCVNSILHQSMKGFNLLILDNCSTDGTLAWLKSLKDPRISIYESTISLSIEDNWKRIVSIKKNEFVTLIGHDDILHEDYLSVMNDLIEKYPEASLYQTHFTYIDEKGKKVRSCKTMAEKETAGDFLESFLTNNIDIMGTGFMMRSIDYDFIGGIPDYPSLLFADFELWLTLTKMSFKVTSSQTCFSFRVHTSTTSKSPDKKMQDAFERFIYFLARIKEEGPELRDVILQHAVDFISVYCKGLTHRLLRTPRSERENLTVSSFTRKCKGYADLLVPGNHFYPSQVLSVRIAEMLDGNAFGRFLFLLFKKIYSRPVLK